MKCNPCILTGLNLKPVTIFRHSSRTQKVFNILKDLELNPIE